MYLASVESLLYITFLDIKQDNVSCGRQDFFYKKKLFLKNLVKSSITSFTLKNILTTTFDCGCLCCSFWTSFS